MENKVIKVDFKKLKKKTDRQAMAEYNAKYGFKGKRPVGPEFLQSKKRLDRALDRLNKKTYDLTVNVEYWKKHGKLPERIDVMKKHRDQNNRNVKRGL